MIRALGWSSIDVPAQLPRQGLAGIVNKVQKVLNSGT
jgi:hypothetical protein